ncbi:caspase family protein [Parvicella tangerina]|uniref:Peptidase C14 caspase domain-containing protein n=1 Tax=Parvicella tangerina TaxID=2829795 RepID=A0A916NJJ1_9FLAO|nr:caspase family protein [Parvicella tangerina]CAG5086910.1 hypothetical protein CRYO30217_03327 [Parvicella tangerina]
MQNGHTLPVSCVAVHPKLPIVATGSQDHSVILWNIETQKQLGSLHLATSPISSIRFNGSGSLLLMLINNGEVILYDREEAKILARRTFSSELGYIKSVALTGDNRSIIVGSNRDELFIWNIATNQTYNLTKGFDTRVNKTITDQTSTYLIDFNGANGFALINTLSNDTVLIPFDKPQNYAFNPQDDLLAVGSRKLFAKVYQPSTGKLIATLAPNAENKCDGCNTYVFWSHNGKQLATYDNKNGLYIWEKPFKKPLFHVELSERINFYSYSKNNRYILLSNDKTVWLIDSETGKIKLTHNSHYLTDFQPVLEHEAKSFFLPGESFTLQKISLNGKILASYKGANNQTSNQLPFDYLDWYQSGSLKHFKQQMPMVVSREKDYLVLGRIGQEVQKLDLKSGHISSLFSSNKVFTALALSKNDSLLAAGDADGNLIIYDLTQRIIVKELEVHSNMIFDLSFDKANDKVISSGWEGRTYEIDLHTGEKKFIQESPYAHNQIETDGKNLYYFKTSLDNTITMYERDSHQEVRTFLGHTGKINSLYYDASNQLLYSSSQDGSVRIWDIKSGLLTNKFFLRNKTAALSICKHPDSPKLFVGGMDRKLYIIDLEEATLSTTEVNHTSGIANIQFIQNDLIALRGLDGVVQFVHLQNPKHSVSLFAYPSGDWLALEPSSMQFDGTKTAMKHIHLVKGEKTKEIGNLFNQYYSPGIIERFLKGDTINQEEGRNIEEILDNSIDFQLTLKDKYGALVLPTPDSMYRAHSQKITLQVDFQQRKKYQDILVYNNQKLVLTESSDEEVAFRGTNQRVIIEVPLAPQKNEIEVKVIDQQNIEHIHDPLIINYDTVAAKMDLFIISLGINKYENKSYDLRYAKNDASAFLESLSTISNPLYEEVYTYSLTDKKVTKSNVLKTIDEISKKIGPEDVFVFYYAGHGVMYGNDKATEDFFLVMSDVTNLYGGIEVLSEKGLSSEEILSISKNIPAQKQVFFLDACQSGGALNVLSTRGVSREKTIAQLARSSGTYFITASQDVEYANESSSLEHGLFTYAVLEILTGNATITDDRIVSIGELKSYVETRVPELSEQFKTSPQYPTGYAFGNDFPIGVLDTE